MRFARLLFVLAVVISPIVLSSTPASAQQAATAQPAAMPACDGSYNIVHVSEIKSGMMQKFLDAVAAQKAWYKNAGASDEIAVLRIIDRDPDTKASSYSTTQAITTHVVPAPSAQGPARDEAFKAFVALYNESSTIKSEYFTCMAK